MAAALFLASAAPPAAGQEGFIDVVASHGGSSDTLRVLVDTQEPDLEITSPASGSVVAGNVVTVGGTARDALDEDLPPTPLFGRLEWRVRDASFVTLDQGFVPIVDGRFTIPDIALGNGEHVIEVRTWDSAGQEGFDEVDVVSDPDAPPVVLVGLQDGEAVLTTSVAVDLNFAEPTTLVSVNGVPDGRTFPLGLTADAITVPLSIGPNVVTLELDAGSGPFSYSFTLFRAESAGPIRITSPGDGSLTNQPELTVAGTVPRGTPFVTVNGEPAVLGADGVTFTAPVSLSEGHQEIVARAFPFGQEDRVGVRLDTVPPAFDPFFFPEDGAVTGEPDVVFGGFVTESATVEALGPGGEVEARTDFRFLFEDTSFLGVDPVIQYLFELPPLALADGPNAIDLRLRDRAGNESLHPLTITRSDAALVLESPADGSTVPGLRTDVVVHALADVTIQSLFSAGRRIAGFDGVSFSGGGENPPEITLTDVPVAPGVGEIRIVYQRHDNGGTEVLAFDLESLATDAATVTGTVTDARTGEALGGALVSVVVNGTEYVVPTRPDGSYVLAVEPGDVQVRVEHEGFAQIESEGMPAGGETFVTDASLIPWGVIEEPVPTEPEPDSTNSVSGTVTDLTTGEPLEGALVIVTQADDALSEITGPSGTYAIGDIPAGEFEVTITRVGFFPQVFTGGAGEPGAVGLDVALEPLPETVTLVGTVIDQDAGSRVPGVLVDVMGTELRVATDENGEFVIEDAPLGEQTLRFRRAGFLDAFSFVNLEPQPSSSLVEETFRLSFAAGSVVTRAIPPDATGTVIDRFTLRPLAGITVEALSLVTGEVVATAVTDDAGAFAFEGLELFDTLEVTAQSGAYQAQSIEAFVVPEGDEVLDFRLRSSEEGQLAGTVTDAATGEPVALAEIRLVDGSLATASEGDGSYDLLGVPPGAHDVEVVHAAYFPATVEGLSVSPDQTVPLSVSLEPRPTTGGLTGRVLDAQTGAPVFGAELEGPDGASAIADAEGSYLLEDLPSGLVEVTLTADGFPTQVRTAVVDADRSDTEPTLREADLELTADGSFTVEASATVPVTGGSVALPDGSFRLDLPPLALSGDAIVTLRRIRPPELEAGQSVPLESKLGAPPVFSLGGGVEILLESTTPGETAPVFVGPVVVSARYSAAAAEGFDIAEEGILPAYFDEDRGTWTLFRMVPYLHAVDRVNRQMAAGLSIILTAGGDPITARLQTPEPVQLAGSIEDLPVVREIRRFTVAVVGALKDLVSPLLVDRTGRLLFFELDQDFPQLDIARRWTQNARPLLVFHGWDPKTFFFNSRPMDRGDIHGGRYGDILRDLADGTDGVYRPVFGTYNSRMGLESIGNLFKDKVREKKIELSGEPSSLDPSKRGKFSTFDSFGFSMGGLAQRAYQREHEPSRSIESMVSMGTPHHGGLQLLRLALDGALGGLTGFLEVGVFEVLVSKWSPGTGDLLGYSDIVCDRGEAFSLFSGNETLCRMNRDVSTAPDRRMSMIAGNRANSLSELYDRFEENLEEGRFKEGVRAFEEILLDPEFRGVDLNPLDEMASEGFLGTGCIDSDGVVCVWSAHGRAGPLSGPVAAFSNARVYRSVRDFDHQNAGRIDPNNGRRNQPISDFRDQDILPNLTDWAVSRLVEPPHFIPPTESEPGEASRTVAIEYNVHHGDITGSVLVLYGGYRNDQDEIKWKILAGADADGNVNTDGPTFQVVDGNSVGGEDIELFAGVSLDVIDPQDPSTDIEVVRALVRHLGRGNKEVPLTPDAEDNFFIPNPEP